MVLELGGEQPPLRETLLGVRAQQSPPVEKPEEPRSEPSLEVLPPVLAAPRTVTLSAGQTLYGIAREHLGSGDRWPELLELNQWTAEDARRLPAGTVVKLPDK